MADKPKRGLTAKQWTEVRKAYEGGEAILALSKRFKVNRRTIMSRRDREQWTAHVDAHCVDRTLAKTIQQRATSNVIELASRRVVEQAESAGVVAAMASDLLNTMRASQLASEYAVELLLKAKNGEIRPAAMPGEQTLADVFKAVMSGYKLFASTTREIAGLKPGMPTVADVDEPMEPVQIIRTIVRTGESKTA